MVTALKEKQMFSHILREIITIYIVDEENHLEIFFLGGQGFNNL